MFKKYTDSIREQIFHKVKLENKMEYQKEREHIELFRIKILAEIVALFEVIMILLSFGIGEKGLLLQRGGKYFHSYLLLLAFMVLYAILYHFLENKVEKSSAVLVGILSFTFYGVLLIWSVHVSIDDISYKANIMTFILTMVVIAAASASRPWITILAQAAAEAVFVYLLQVNPISSDIRVIYQVNSLYGFVFSVLMLYFMNRSRIEHFNAKMKIIEQNNALILLSEELKIYNMDLKKRASVDPLTEVFNKGTIEQKLLDYWMEMKVKKSGLAVMMLDIDYFKTYNDTYGHQMGDDCLKIIASAISHKIAKLDGFMARFGGEEFIIAIPDTSKEVAKEEAEMLRKLVENLNIEHNESKIAKIVTISIGIYCAIPDEACNANQFIHFADKALYKAKRKSRNTVFLLE